MTYEEKKEYLQKAFDLNKQYLCDIDELEQLNSIKSNLKAIDYSKERVQESGSGEASYTRVVDKIVNLELKLLEEVDQMLDISADIENIISKLDNLNERLVCKYRHIQFKKWEEIADMMHMSKRHVQRIHKTAVLHICL